MRAALPTIHHVFFTRMKKDQVVFVEFIPSIYLYCLVWKHHILSFNMVSGVRSQSMEGQSLHPHNILGLPWQVMGIDLFEYAVQM